MKLYILIIILAIAQLLTVIEFRLQQIHINDLEDQINKIIKLDQVIVQNQLVMKKVLVQHEASIRLLK